MIFLFLRPSSIFNYFGLIGRSSNFVFQIDIKFLKNTLNSELEKVNGVWLFKMSYFICLYFHQGSCECKFSLITRCCVGANVSN